ncbi:DUF4232 domain-containing protein [Streptomyces sp. RFCAC02]|uniref:DUF4232 domain-containing protein n=1 Tax=Streptomyces sp. RFCAC02 TaxID=2499143 RepID=UPI001020A744|nr:DUF4232 domain-containing protein [Streptomyces sp. RFCAC02]
MTSRDEPHGGAHEPEPSELLDVFRLPGGPLAPPPGHFAAVRRRAAARRRRHVLAAGGAAVVCVAAAAAAVTLTRADGPAPIAGPPPATETVSHGAPSGGDDGVRPSPPAPEESAATTTEDAAPSGTGGVTASEPADASPTEPGDPQEPPRCASGVLDLSLAGSEGAAGSLYLTLALTNTGDETCTMTGFPGVSLVAGEAGPQIGAPAGRDTARGSGETVELAPGGTAWTDVRVTQAGNYPAEECDPAPAGGLRVYPPDERDALFLPDDTLTGCVSEDVPLLTVTPVYAAEQEE